MNVTIRQAIRDDAAAIHKLHTESARELYKNHYSNDLIHGWLDHLTPEGYFSSIDKGILFVEIEGSVIVGFGGAVPGEIHVVYALPVRIKEGIGSLLLGHAMEIA